MMFDRSTPQALEHFLAYGWSSTEAMAPRELVRGSEWTRSKANCHSLPTLSHAISWNTSAHTYRNSSAVCKKKTKSVNLLSPLTRECWAQLGFIFLHTAEEKQLKKWVTKLDSSLLTWPCQRNESFPAASATLLSCASPQHQLESALQHPPTRALFFPNLPHSNHKTEQNKTNPTTLCLL